MQWPPSPLVEDEDVSLAKECATRVPLDSLKTDNQGANSRGAVDQYPIILDNLTSDDKNHIKVPAADKPCELTPDSSSIDEQEPKTPSLSNKERRFVFIPSNNKDPERPPSSQKASDANNDGARTLRPEILHRSKSTTQLKDQDSSRTRPHVSRIHTDVGQSPDDARHKSRRAPSPYAHVSSASMLGEAFTPRPIAKDNLLSPMDAQKPKRPVSVHPRSRAPLLDSSDSDHKSKSRRYRERSRSRPSRPNPSHYEREEPESSRRSKSTRRRSPESGTRRNERRHRSRGPAEGGYGHYSYTDAESITPPQTPKPIQERARSPRLDTTAQATSTRYSNRPTTDSPYTSSAEEGHGRRYDSSDDRRSAHQARSRRASRSTRDRPSETQSSHVRPQFQDKTDRNRYSRDFDFPEQTQRNEPLRSPVSAQKPSKDPKAMEDMFNKALAANESKRANKTAHYSRPTSPPSSAPNSPPRTPRGESSSRDYFEPPSIWRAPTHTSRPPSADDGRLKDFKAHTTLLGVATLGASIASKVIPSLSRTNTSNSVDTPTSSSQSWPTSGQRSRKASPTLGEGAIPSPPPSAPVSRHNSYVSREGGPSIRTTTYAIHDDYVSPKDPAQSPSYIEVPRSASSRSASYSYSPDQHRPPAPFRAQSSNLAPSQQIQYVQPQQSFIAAQPYQYNDDLAKTMARLPVCSRPKPVAGYHDWYTIRDLANVQFCPTCTKVLGNSPLRSHLVPRFSQDQRPVACTMGLVWFRLAWLQTMRQSRPELRLLWKITAEPPAQTRKCMGSQSDIRRWYHLTDPRTKRPVEGFDVCSSCVRNLDMIFPQLLDCKLFDRPGSTLIKEKVCTLNTSSRHFLDIISDLDKLANRQSKGYLQAKDIEAFVDHVRSYCRYRECARDTMLDTPYWHHIHDLPELTICEDCYMDFVWPLVNRPIAREVSKSLVQVPPRRRSQGLHGISCQLYSPRMRNIFLNAVNRNDFESLKSAAMLRFETEHHCQETHRRLEQDMSAGIDRSAEIQNNINRWKAIE